MNCKNLDNLMKGNILLCELRASTPADRVWLELSLLEDLVPDYPFRTEPYAKIGHSPYFNKCSVERAQFRIRESTFNAQDIEHGLEPSYDRVGPYQTIESWDSLLKFLELRGLSLEHFVDASTSDDYPL